MFAAALTLLLGVPTELVCRPGALCVLQSAEGTRIEQAHFSVRGWQPRMIGERHLLLHPNADACDGDVVLLVDGHVVRTRLRMARPVRSAARRACG